MTDDLLATLADVDSALELLSALATRRRETIVPALRSALESSDVIVRGFAALALADLGEKDGDDLILGTIREFDYTWPSGPVYRLLDEAMWRLRVRLGEGHSIDVIDEMLRALAAAPPNEAEWIDVRRDAIRTLGEVRDLDDPRVVAVLRKAVEEESAFEIAPLALDVLEDVDPSEAAEARRAYSLRPDAPPESS